MDLRFLMSHHRRYSVTDKVDLFRFKEKHTPQTECGPSQRVNGAVRCGMVSFYRLGNFIC